MATNSLTWKDDNGNTVDQEFSSTVASSAVTIAFAAVANYFWMVTRIVASTDAASPNLTFKSNSAVVQQYELKAAGVYNESTPAIMTRDGNFGGNGVRGSDGQDLTLVLDATTTAALNVTAVRLPVRSFNQGA